MPAAIVDIAAVSIDDDSGRSHGHRRAQTDEARLVDAARHGNRAAFACLHERYAPMVHGVALARGPASEGQDIVQEVFLHAMRNLHTLRDSAAFGPWLASITRNLARQVHRQRPREVASLVGDSQACDDRESQRATSNQTEAMRILSVIRSLPEAYSETLVLRLVEGMTGPQIAVCTGLSPGGVRVNLHRGMTMLKQRLGLELGEVRGGLEIKP